MSTPPAADRPYLVPLAPPEDRAPRSELALRIPASPTPLIARDREVVAVVRLLGGAERAASTRLVTLTGPGGVGKTRLALAVARQVVPTFADGVTFVSLAPVREPEWVLASIAQALDVPESSNRSPLEIVIAHLRDGRGLLVLDNFEHVVAAAPLVTDLLVACRELRILVTSRTRLRLTGEYAVPVPPLAVPAAGHPATVDAIGGLGAVRLFTARAQAVTPDFALTDTNAPAIAEICRRLDGLPLAIELAAARTRALSPAALLARLTNRLSLLTDGPRDVPERLRTMRDAIAWSDDLLTADEQALFRRLAVFIGGFTLEAAEAVGRMGEDGGRREDAAADPSVLRPPSSVLELVETLLDASLVRRIEGSGDGTVRFGALETIAEYGRERLAAAGEEAATRDAHADYFLALAERAEPELLGPDQLPWFALLEAEQPNLRAALDWLRDRPDCPEFTEKALRLAGALGLFWTWPPFIREGRAWLEAVLALPRAVEYPALFAKALNATGILAEWQGDLERARAVLDRALAVREALGDRIGVAEVLGSLGNVALGQGDLDRAEAVLTACVALYRELGQPFWEAETLVSLGSVAGARGDHRRAVDYFEQSAASWRAQSGPTKLSDALIPLGWSSYLLGEFARSRESYAEALALELAAEDHLRIGRCLRGAAGLVAAAGAPLRAARLLAVDALQREQVGVPLRPANQAELDRLISTVRDALNPAAFAAAWESGHAMELAEAAAEAATIFAGPTTIAAARSDRESTDRYAVITGDSYGLTARERDVLRLLIDGRSDKEIAAALSITRRTASNHVTAIRAKLGVPSRTAAVAAATRGRFA